jgi:hypothetical protein
MSPHDERGTLWRRCRTSGNEGKCPLSVNCSINAVVCPTGVPCRSLTNPLRLPPALSIAMLAESEL